MTEDEGEFKTRILQLKQDWKIRAQAAFERELMIPNLKLEDVFPILDEARKDAPIHYINGKWEHTSGKPVAYEKYRSDMLNWFEKWFGVKREPKHT